MKTISYRWITDCIAVCFLLFFPLQSLFSQNPDVLPNVPQKYYDMAEKYGLTLDLGSFYKNSDGEAVKQEDFNAFLEKQFADMSLLGPKFIHLSRCSNLSIRKHLLSGNGVFDGKKLVALKYPFARFCNHELFHAYDLFYFAPRFWSAHNHPDFVYSGRGFIIRGLGESTYCQLWRASSNITRFSTDFMRRYGQVNPHEDAAVVFESMIDPQKIGALKKKMQKSRFLKKKVLLTAAQTSWGMGNDYWQKKLELSPEDSAEFNKIRDALDLEKQYHIKIHYTRNQLKRYGYQLRTTYSLLDLSEDFLAASGVKEIYFQQEQGSSSKGSTLTVEDGNAYSLCFRLFIMYCRNQHITFGSASPCRTLYEASKIFGLMLLNPENCARQAFKSGNYRDKVDHLKNITADHIPKSFWADYDRCLQDLAMEESVRKHFADSGIRVVRELPSGVSGKIVSEMEQVKAEKVLQLCCYLYSLDFLKQCGYKKIVFAKDMCFEGRKRSHLGIKDTLCLYPELPLILFHFSRESFLRYDAGRKHPGWKWKTIHRKNQKFSPDYLSSAAAGSPQHERAGILAFWIASYHDLQEKSRKSPILKKKILYVLQLPVFSPYAVRLFRDRERGEFTPNIFFPEMKEKP